MLAADKLQLQSALKQQATALKEKEFNLHHSNFMTVGTQAAVLAGLDITMFIEFNPPSETAWQEEHRWLCRNLRAAYYAIIIGGFCANMIVVSQTTALSVLGAGLALRGPDGSMVTATDGLYEERKTVFKTFALGLALTVGSLLVGVWLLLEWEAAAVCWLVALFTSRRIFLNYHRVAARFDFDESETVDFTDIFQGPAAIRAVPVLMNQVVAGWTNHHNNNKSGGGGGGGGSYYTSNHSKNGMNMNGHNPVLPTTNNNNVTTDANPSPRRSFFFGGGSSFNMTTTTNNNNTERDNSSKGATTSGTDKDDHDLEQPLEKELSSTVPQRSSSSSLGVVKRKP